MRRLTKHVPKYAPNFVLVRFKSTPTAAAVATVQAKAPVVPGLQLVSLTGEHQDIRVPSGSGPEAAAAAAAPLPANAVMKFRITDGSKVEAKVKQLQANPGAGAAAACGQLVGYKWQAVCAKLKCACPSPQFAYNLRLQPAPPPLPAAVEHAQPEYIYYHTAQRLPNDPKFAAGDHTSGQWYLPQVWAPTAWATTVGSRDMRVCVVSWCQTVVTQGGA